VLVAKAGRTIQRSTKFPVRNQNLGGDGPLFFRSGYASGGGLHNVHSTMAGITVGDQMFLEMQDFDFVKCKQICPNLITFAQFRFDFALISPQFCPNQTCSNLINFTPKNFANGTNGWVPTFFGFIVLSN